MPSKLSRRTYLASLAALCAGTAWGQEPNGDTGVRISRNTLSVPSRSIQMRAGARVSDAQLVVTAIAADPSGTRLAVAGDDFSIRIMDAESFQVRQTLLGHRDVIRTLAFDPSGRLLVSAGNDGQLIVWEGDDEFRVSQRMTDTPALTCVSFSPATEQFAAVGFSDRIFVVGKAGVPEIADAPAMRCDCGDLRAVTYRDDGQLLAAAGRSGKIYLFHPETGELLASPVAHRGRVHSIAFHRHSNVLVTVGEDGYVTIIDTLSKQVKSRLSVTTAKLFTLTIVDSQRVAVAGSDNAIRIVNTDEQRVESRLQGHHGTVASLVVRGGMLYSGGYDAALRRWSIGDLLRSRQRIAEVTPGIDR